MSNIGCQKNKKNSPTFICVESQKIKENRPAGQSKSNANLWQKKINDNQATSQAEFGTDNQSGFMEKQVPK